MKVNWVISKDIKPLAYDKNEIKAIGPLWGSPMTWRYYKTDNCVCNLVHEASELIRRSFNEVCNLWIPERFFAELGRPTNIKLFGGEFVSEEFKFKDDIVALWLAANDTDIVLLLGFNLHSTDGDSPSDRKGFYRGIAKVIKEHPGTQFVLVDHNNELSAILNDNENLTQDSFDAVKELLC